MTRAERIEAICRAVRSPGRRELDLQAIERVLGLRAAPYDTSEDAGEPWRP